VVSPPPPLPVIPPTAPRRHQQKSTRPCPLSEQHALSWGSPPPLVLVPILQPHPLNAAVT